MKKRLKLILLLAVIFTHTVPVSALSDAYLEKFAQNNIVFYNPESECTGAENNNTRCVQTGGTVPDGSKITWIGDSYTEGTASQIESMFPGIDLHYQACKHFKSDNASCGGDGGLTVLQNEVGSNLREYLVFALGTNVETYSLSDTIPELKTKATGFNSNVKIILVSSRTRNYEYADETKTMQDAAAGDSNIMLADWNAASKDHMDEYFDGRCNYGDTDYQDNCTHPNATGYSAWLDTIKSALGGGGGGTNCTAGMLSGDTVEERIWNYFVSANIPGVSDNPAVIAGILGNFYVESGYNPFMLGSSGESYRGLWMLYIDYGGAAIRDRVNDAVGSDHWKFYGWWGSPTTVDEELAKEFNASQTEIDAAVKVELDYLTNVQDYSTWQWFLDGLNEVSHNSGTEGAESYAELFLGIIENAYGDGDSGGPFKDQKVQAYTSRKWGSGHTTWQGADKRREAAVDAYNRLSNKTTGATPTTTTTPDGGTTTVNTPASSSGFTKYQLTDNEIFDIAEVAKAENGGTDNGFKFEVSLMANLYERANHSKYPTIVDYIAEPTSHYGGEGWFATFSYINNGARDTDKDGNQIISTSEESHYIEMVRSVLVDGNRTLPTQIVEHDDPGDIQWIELDGVKYYKGDDAIYDITKYVKDKTKILALGDPYIFYSWANPDGTTVSSSSWGNGTGDPFGYFENDPPTSMPASASSASSNSNCPTTTSNSGSGGIAVLQAALKMAWPVMSGQGDDSHVGQCESSAGNWVSWDSSKDSCYHYPRELYRENKAKYDTGCGDAVYEDCGYFMATVLYTAGVDENGKAPKCGTAAIDTFLSESSNWDPVDNTGTEDNLKPGDIFVTPAGHVSMYAGSYGGTYGKQVHASRDDRVGTLTDYVADQAGGKYVDSHGTPFNIYRIKGGGTISEGGLTFEQAKTFMKAYGANKNSSSSSILDQYGEWNVGHLGCNGGGGSNCVSFSVFFLHKFTDTTMDVIPNGTEIVSQLRSQGVSTGSEPKVFSVFSWDNHTGVILGYQNGEWIVGHASCQYDGGGEGTGGDGTAANKGGGSGFVLKSSDISTALLGKNATGYAYPNVDTAKISQYLETGE